MKTIAPQELKYYILRNETPLFRVFCNIMMHVNYEGDRKLHKIKGMRIETN